FVGEASPPLQCTPKRGSGTSVWRGDSPPATRLRGQGRTRRVFSYFPTGVVSGDGEIATHSGRGPGCQTGATPRPHRSASTAEPRGQVSRTRPARTDRRSGKS